ncbi:hypothetical protein DPMN_136538 [Dreissena polymorpha]|uniref:Uncharacterized protein n=1 Tax=Dreissena polymorpha TaxID=45954 RepID=A0A9D4G620_DREPO|nr:hypothetical protein DPMN_136538 [Dreissena polymorpha]
MCDPSATRQSSATSYKADDNYKEGISQSGCCADAFDSSATCAKIQISVIDMTLNDEASDCNQKLYVETNGIHTAYTCSHNTYFTFTTLVNTAIVTFKHDVNSVGRGRPSVKATGTVCDTSGENMDTTQDRLKD